MSALICKFTHGLRRDDKMKLRKGAIVSITLINACVKVRSAVSTLVGQGPRTSSEVLVVAMKLWKVNGAWGSGVGR